jgi:hypothetical protein
MLHSQLAVLAEAWSALTYPERSVVLQLLLPACSRRGWVFCIATACQTLGVAGAQTDKRTMYAADRTEQAYSLNSEGAPQSL